MDLSLEVISVLFAIHLALAGIIWHGATKIGKLETEVVTLKSNGIAEIKKNLSEFRDEYKEGMREMRSEFNQFRTFAQQLAMKKSD